MDMIGYWSLGAFVASIVFRLTRILTEPLLEYAGDNPALELVSEWAEESFQTIGAALFLSLPLAALGACYALGRSLWSLVG